MNYATGNSIPFTIPEISHGFQEASGLMKLTEEGIELECKGCDPRCDEIRHKECGYSLLQVGIY